MPPKKRAVAHLEKAAADGDAFRATVPYWDKDGKTCRIRGPRRAELSEAQADLDAMHACAAHFHTREEGITAVKAEARRIQERVAYERESQSIEKHG